MWLHHSTDEIMAEKTTPNRTPDHRSEFVLDTRELGRRAGNMRIWRRRLSNPEALGTSVVGVPAGQEVDLDLRLESVSEGVLVTGTIVTELQAECGRCLDPVVDELVMDVCELFAYPNSTTDATTEQDEVHRIVGDLLDLEQMVRDAIVLALPATIVCRPDCAGLCSECGQRLDDLPADHSHTMIDSRWAALQALTVPTASSGQTSQE